MTGFVHDPEHTGHDLAGHAEHADRVGAAAEALSVAGLVKCLQPKKLRPATGAELEAVHTPAMLRRIEQCCSGGGGHLDPDTYCCPLSWEIARRASGSLVALTQAVLAGDQPNGLALIRPPGHHATGDRSMGFCLTNHVAVAARAAQQQAGLQRVAIVDFDVHHGNGTAAVFAADGDVLYVSSHQYPHYPGTGSPTDQGTGSGHGTTVNLPLPAGTGDQGFLASWQQVGLPAVRRFQPELILVSAGFDAHRADPLAQLLVSTAGYRWLVGALVRLAADICGGRIVLALEGGYDLTALGECVVAAAEVLLDPDCPVADPRDAETGPGSEPDLSELLVKLRTLHGL